MLVCCHSENRATSQIWKLLPNMVFPPIWAFSSPEAAILLVSTENHDLWPAPTPEVRDSRTSRYSAHALSQVWQIWLVLVSIYCVYKAIQNQEVRDSGTSRYSAHALSQVWQIWLVLVSIYCVYKAIQNQNVVGPGQRSWFSVLTKRIAASGDENADFGGKNDVVLSMRMQVILGCPWTLLSRARVQPLYGAGRKESSGTGLVGMLRSFGRGFTIFRLAFNYPFLSLDFSSDC